jgi:hypothetical protein
MMAEYDPRKIVRTVYFHLIVLLLLGSAFVIHVKYTRYQLNKVAERYEISMQEWSDMVRQYGPDEARQRYKALQRTKPYTKLPKIFFFTILIIGIYLSVKTRSLAMQYGGDYNVKTKMQVDLAITLLTFLLYALAFMLIKFNMVDESNYIKWLYGPIVLSALCIIHYFYRPIRKVIRGIFRFLTRPFRHKVTTLDELEKGVGKSKKGR